MVKQVEDFTLADIQTARDAIEYYYEQGWTDGLPVVPPVEEFVAEFLAQTRRRPDETLLTQTHLNRTCSVRQAAINAVMEGASRSTSRSSLACSMPSATLTPAEVCSRARQARRR